MKFFEMSYKRPDVQDVKSQLAILIERLGKAADYTAAKGVF